MFTVNKNYIKYLFEQNKKVILSIFLIGFAICPIMAVLNTIDYANAPYYSLDSTPMPFMQYLVVQMIIMFIIPIVNYRFVQYKKSCDTYLSLPIKRETMFNSVILFSLVEVLVPYLINILIGVAVVVCKGYPFFVGNIALFLITSITLLMVLFFINSFIVLKCNNTIDSIICMLAYTLLPFAIYLAHVVIVDYYTYGVMTFPSLEWQQSITSMIINSSVFLYKAFDLNTQEVFELIWYFIYLIIGIIGLLASRYVFIHRKAEDSEQITDSRLMYKLLIPLYTIVCISCFTIKRGIKDYVIAMIVIFIFYCIATFIANRKLIINRWIVLMFIGAMLVTNVGGLIFSKTIAKQMSLDFPKELDSASMTINVYINEMDMATCLLIEDQETLKDIQNLQTELVNDYYDGVEIAPSTSSIMVAYSRTSDNELKDINYYYPITIKQGKELLIYAVKKGCTVNRYDHHNNTSNTMTLSEIEKLDVE